MFVNRIIHITFTFIIVVLRYPISLHRRSGFIFVKLIMMSENNFEQGGGAADWICHVITTDWFTHSMKKSFPLWQRKKYVNKWYSYLLRMLGHFLVFLSKSTYSSYSVCFSLLCGLSSENWQLCLSSILGWGYWVFPKGLIHDFESKFEHWSFLLFFM